MGQRNARPPRGGRGRIGMAADIVQIVSGLVSIAESGVNMGMQAGETRASGSGENIDNTPKKAEEVKLPHKFEAIVEDADSHIDKSSNGKLYEQLYSGVFLNQKRKKYWIDKETRGNGFIMYARDLNIGLGVWHWIPVEETRNVFVEAAELMTASSLDIVGKFDTTYLSPLILYEIVFVIMKKVTPGPSQLKLLSVVQFPNGLKQEHTVDSNMQENKWVEIPVGKFITSPENEGKMQISLNGTAGEEEIAIKGIIIRPKS